MPQANRTITIPDGVWIGDISRAHPDARIRIPAALTGDDAGVGLAEITAPDLAAILSDVHGSQLPTPEGVGFRLAPL